MTSLEITNRAGNTLGLTEAVERATFPHSGVTGVIETLRERIELQDRLIARLLMVIVNDFGDEFVSKDHSPATRADQLAFILNGGVETFTVNEVPA